MKKDLDFIFVGGGLSTVLLAHRLLRLRPELDFLILEKNDDFSKRETWSFHSSDLSPSELEWVLPLASKSWSGYTVRFPSLERNLLSTEYNSIRSEDLHRKLGLSPKTRFSAEASSVSDRGVYLRNGDFLSAKCVIDARGLSQVKAARVGFQKFVGIDFELSAPHGLVRPLLMDATVDQKDGYRFFYLLPWSKTSLLIEDTRYSSHASYDVEAYRNEIFSYAEKKKFRVLRETRMEHAALPIPLSNLSRRNNNSALCIGTKGGFFHHATGYSLPMAVRIADLISRQSDLSVGAVKGTIEKARSEFSPGNEFSSLLNRMLFCGAEPEERRRIFARFYSLPERLVQRFYSGRPAKLDYARILVGKPPISIRRAFSALTNEDAKLC